LPKRASRGVETKTVSFRLPLTTYNELIQIADARNTDLTAIFNWMVSEYMPILLARQYDLERNLFASAVTRLPVLLAGQDAGEARRTVDGLLQQLQTLSRELAGMETARKGGGGQRAA
jgi:hypothetical protein